MSKARWVWEQLASRAVYTVATVEAGLAMGVAFGLEWDATQVASVVAFSSALLAMIFGQAVVRKPSN